MTCKTQSESQLLCSTLLVFTLLYLYPYPTSTLPLPLSLLLPLLLFSTPLFSALRCSTLPPSTLPLLYLYLTLPLLSSSLLYLHSTSALPLLYLFSTSRRCQLDTMIFGPARMWVNDLLMQVPAGHNDLWASENVKVRNSEFLYETSFDNQSVVRSLEPGLWCFKRTVMFRRLADLFRVAREDFVQIQRSYCQILLWLLHTFAMSIRNQLRIVTGIYGYIASRQTTSKAPSAIAGCDVKG